MSLNWTMRAIDAGIPAKIDVAMIGGGPSSFISNAAHRPGLSGSELFEVKWGAVHPEKPDDKRWFQKAERLNPCRVTCGLDDMLKAIGSDAYAGPVFDICTPTPLHADQICQLAKRGRNIITDKPIVTCAAELTRIMGATNNGEDVNVFLTFNHRYAAPVFMLRELVARDPSAVERIDGGFLQSWLIKNPNCPQGDWRIGHPLCGLLDIGTHVADLCSFVAGREIKVVSNGKVERVGAFAQEKGFSDCGSANFMFHDYDFVGSARYHQSLAGHSDDIYVMVTMTNGTRYLWRMEWGSDTLFMSAPHNMSVTLESRDGWEAHLRGDSPIFDGSDTNSQFCETPPGHIPGWPMYWIRMFQAIGGHILRERGDKCAEQFPPVMRLPVPMLQDAGLHITKYVEAHAKSARRGGAKVELADIVI